MQEAEDFWLFEEFFFEGEWRWDRAEAFSDAGTSTVHGGEEVLEGIDRPPESATGFFRGVTRPTIRDVKVDAK